MQLVRNTENFKKMQEVKLKAFMFDVKGLDIKLTKDEQHLLAFGKEVPEEGQIQQMLMKLGCPEHIRVAEEVKRCCLQALYTGVSSAKIDNNYKSKRFEAGDVIDCIISAHYAYLQLLKRIRKRIITVEQPVNYNDKI